MKKFLIIVLVLIMIPAAIFAKGVLSVGLGATASTGSTISNVIENRTVDTKSFNYGAYANVKLLLFSVNATMFPKFNDDKTMDFAGDLAANFAVDIAFLRVQAGLSVNYFGSANQFKDWKFQFEAEDIKDAPLNVRAEIDLMLGDLNIGVWGLLPTPATLVTLEKILDVKDKWQDASIGICLGVCF